MRTIGIFCLTALAMFAAGVDAHAQGNSGRGRNAAPAEVGSNVDVDVVFGSDEIGLIRAWFGDSRNLQGLPPGLAKRETLPPGLERQLRRNGTLPPGLQGRIHPLPVELERRLPDLDPGQSRVVIGGRVVLLDGDLILDVAAIF